MSIRFEVCVAYRLNGKRLDRSAVRRGATAELRADLPANARLETIHAIGKKTYRSTESGKELHQAASPS